MSIRAKLFFSFLFISLMILALFVVRQYYSIKEAELIREIVLDHKISSQLSGLSSAAQKIRRFEKEFFIYVNNPEKRNKYAGEFYEANEEINQFLKQLISIYSQYNYDTSSIALAEWAEAGKYYAVGFEALVAKVQTGEISNVIDANSAIQDYKNRFRVVLDGTDKAIKQQYQLATEKADLITQYQSTSSAIFIVISTLSFLIALLMSFLVPASIVKPLKQLTDIANGISKGQVRESIDVKGSIEIENLSKSIRRLQLATLGLLKRLQTAKQTRRQATE